MARSESEGDAFCRAIRWVLACGRPISQLMRCFACRRKVEMSDLCKVEPSISPSGRGAWRNWLGLILMSGNELQCIEVLAEVLSRRRTEASAAAILGISTRQVRRLLVAYRDGGGASLIHKSRGRASNNSLPKGIREYALELVRSKYADFGPSLAAEMLLTKHDLKISRETLRKWMIGDGLWHSRRQRRGFHQPRLRREAFGELIQIDGSDHRWFEDRIR
jgi:transposase